MPPRKKKETPIVAGVPADISTLTPEQAAALIAELQAKLAVANAAPVTASAEQQDKIRSLSAALTGSKKKARARKDLAEEAANEEVYEVRNCVGATISVLVSGHRGEKKSFIFEKRGSTHFLTASQVQDLRDNTKVFEKGYLSAPDAVAPNANTIPDMEEFLENITADEVAARITEITSKDVLFGIYHHIENNRYEVVGDELKELPLSPKLKLVLHAVMDGIRTKTGMNLSANDAE